MRRRALAMTIVPLLAACSSPLAVPPEVQGSGPGAGASIVPPPRAHPAGALIAKVVTRDAELAIVSTPDGPRFSVANREGDVLASDLGEADLKTQYPAAYELYRFAVARSRGGPYLDATLASPAEERSAPADCP